MSSEYPCTLLGDYYKIVATLTFDKVSEFPSEVSIYKRIIHHVGNNFWDKDYFDGSE